MGVYLYFDADGVEELIGMSDVNGLLDVLAIPAEATVVARLPEALGGVECVAQREINSVNSSEELVVVSAMARVVVRTPFAHAKTSDVRVDILSAPPLPLTLPANLPAVALETLRASRQQHPERYRRNLRTWGLLKPDLEKQISIRPDFPEETVDLPFDGEVYVLTHSKQSIPTTQIATIKRGTVVTIDSLQQPRPGVSGIVLHRDGSPAAEVRVEIISKSSFSDSEVIPFVPEDLKGFSRTVRRDLGSQNSEATLMATLQSDRDGRFSCEFAFTDNVVAYVFDLEAGKGIERRLTGDRCRTIDDIVIRLKPRSSAKVVRIVDFEGRPAANRRFEVTQENDRFAIQFPPAETDSDGFLDSSFLEDGKRYFLMGVGPKPLSFRCTAGELVVLPH